MMKYRITKAKWVVRSIARRWLGKVVQRYGGDFLRDVTRHWSLREEFSSSSSSFSPRNNVFEYNMKLANEI